MGKYILGIDLGGTKINAAVVDEADRILGCARTKTEAQHGEDSVFERIVEIGREALYVAGVDLSDMLAIGIGSPGPLDPDTGYVIHSPNMKFDNFPLGPKLAERFQCPVFLDNDVKVGTYGEYRAGAARGASVVLGVFVGTGIGGGIILDGEIYHGFSKNAGEIGHMLVKPRGPRCGCGARGCLEAVASRSGMVREMRRAVKRGRQTVLTKHCGKHLDEVTSSAIKDAYESGDKLVRTTVNEAAKYIGLGLGGLVNVLGPEVIVLGGGIIEALGDHIMGRIDKAIRKVAFDYTFENVRVVKARLGDDAGVLGAALLAKEKLYLDYHALSSAIPTAHRPAPERGPEHGG
jgi:glucokinase